MSDGKWDKAITLLAQRLTNISIVNDTPVLRDEHIARVLRECLVPLLDAVDNRLCAEFSSNPRNHIEANEKLRKEVEKWREK